MSTAFPFLRLPPELQIRVCEYYFDKPFTIHTFSLAVWSVCQSGPFPHAKALLQASPQLYEQARTALFKAFNGQVNCKLHCSRQLPLQYKINSFLEDLLTYPPPKDRVKHITFSTYDGLGPERKLSIPGDRDWKEFVELVAHSQLLRLELITIEIDGLLFPGVIRGKHDVEPFLQGDRDDALVTCIQKYLPRMGVGDAGRIERADGLVVPVLVSAYCFTDEFPCFNTNPLGFDVVTADVEIEMTNPQAMIVKKREILQG